MNPNKIAIATTLVAAAASTAYAVKTKMRVLDLERELRIKDAVIETEKRHFDLATKHLNAAQLLELLKDIAIDSKFAKITLDI
jgi:CYTH domain-containing protein